MKTRWLTILACLLITACNGPEVTNNVENETKEPEKSIATEPIKSKPSEKETIAPNPLSPSDQYLAIKEKFDKAMSEFQIAYKEASSEERNKIRQEQFPNAADYGAEFFDLVESYPDDDVAFDSLYWIARNVRTGEMADRACELLLSNHIDNEKLKEVFLGLATPGPLVESRLNLLINNSPHDSVKAHATYALAGYYSRLEKSKQRLADQPSANRFDEATVKYLESFNLDESGIESLFHSLINNYPDLKPNERSRRNYKSLAEGALFEVGYLAIGKVAPDIEGEDLDGTTFKLSEYRGKVVVIDFWGDW